MKPQIPFISKKHGLAIAAIVAIGLLAGVAIVSQGPAGTGTTEEHDNPQRSSRDAEHPGKSASDQHGDAKDHGDDDHRTVSSRGADSNAEHDDDGKVTISDEQIQSAGIAIDTAGPADLRSVLKLPGEIKLNEDRTAHIVPRMAGVVESVSVALGQQVKQGQVLAVIASTVASEQRSELQTARKRLELAQTTFEREKRLWEQKISAEQDFLQARQALSEAEVAHANSQQKLTALGLSPKVAGHLNRVELRAPFDGLVIEKHLSLGEAVKEDAAVLTISDLRSVWAEISVAAKDLPLIRVGEKVVVEATAFDATASGTVAFVGALIGEQTRAAKARMVLANPQGSWRPGLFVNVELTIARTKAAVTVPVDSIQTIEDKPSVFIRTGGGFRAKPIRVGRNDGRRVEVLEGLPAGASIAGKGSFTLKAELGKGSTEHEH